MPPRVSISKRNVENLTLGIATWPMFRKKPWHDGRRHQIYSNTRLTSTVYVWHSRLSSSFQTEFETDYETWEQTNTGLHT